MTNNRNEIKLVVGDTLDITFELKSDFQIKEAYFVCKDLNINAQLNRSISKDDYQLLIENTEFFQSGNFDYDIKVVFIDNTLYTACYRGLFQVLPNVNTLERSA